MIRIHKPASPPAILVSAGKRRRSEHSRDFTRSRAAFLCGERTFEFDRSIYSDASVKRELIAAQHDKCCFCESKVSHITSGDVEHFRPKAACRQGVDAAIERPGYYWLAYEWANLYFACEQCNRRAKGSLFPLVDPAHRARSHHQARRVGREAPLFLNPGVDDPEVFIAYRDEVPFAIAANPRAAATIAALNLGRDELSERRRDRLGALQVSCLVIEAARGGTRRLPRDLVEAATRVVAASSRDDAEYAAMSRAALRARFGPHLRFPLSVESLLAYATGGPSP